MSKNYDALTVRFKTPEERSALARAKTIASNRNQSASKFVSDLLARELDGEQDDWTRQMTGFDLDKSARALAEAVTAVLRTTDDWAKQAIVKGQFIPPWAQVFGTRSDQTRREKEHLGQQFSECLCARLEALISTHDQIYLIVDSGTTMYWLVVKFLARLKSSSENLIDKLVIVTNNMPALDAYLSYYRSASETRVECRILPGAALPIYAAVVGAEARNALRDYRNKAQREKTTSYFIGLVAGKWIRISTD